jgi:hypothetical protein
MTKKPPTTSTRIPCPHALVLSTPLPQAIKSFVNEVVAYGRRRRPPLRCLRAFRDRPPSRNGTRIHYAIEFGPIPTASNARHILKAELRRIIAQHPTLTLRSVVSTTYGGSWNRQRSTIIRLHCPVELTMIPRPFVGTETPPKSPN